MGLLKDRNATPRREEEGKSDEKGAQKFRIIVRTKERHWIQGWYKTQTYQEEYVYNVRRVKITLCVSFLLFDG